MRWTTESPRSVALRILDALAGDLAGAGSASGSGSGAAAGRRASSGSGSGPGRGVGSGLASFQVDAVARARRILERMGGVLISDSVGLGKTHMAWALAEEALSREETVVLVTPAGLRRTWIRIAGRHAGLRWVSHTRLSRGTHRPERWGRVGLVVVDEAHAFRNPDSRRYAALARLCRGAKVVLVTATPVNNQLADLHHMLRLFADDDAFRHVGVPSLRECLDPAGGQEAARADPAGARRVVDAVAIRRSRAVLREVYGGAALNGDPVRFPRRAPPRVVRIRDEAIPEAARLISDLELAAYNASDLIRMGLLKRLESGRAAAGRSVRRLAAYLHALVDASREGRLLRPADRHLVSPGSTGEGGSSDGDPVQLVLGELLLDCATPDVPLEELAASAGRDLVRLRRIDARLRGTDPKLAALTDLLDGLARGEKVLVFSEFRDTTEAAWRWLARRGGVGRVDGSGAWLGVMPAGRRTVVERFAPMANQRPEPPPRERVDVLVATDVLSEGLNLQDARHVVSLDLPWNPIRLLQRIGRADRLGSPHDEVVPHLFLPAEGLDELLRLTARLRTKLASIAAAVGAEDVAALSRRLARGGSVADDALRDLDAAAHPPGEMLRSLAMATASRNGRGGEAAAEHGSGGGGPGGGGPGGSGAGGSGTAVWMADGSAGAIPVGRIGLDAVLCGGLDRQTAAASSGIASRIVALERDGGITVLHVGMDGTVQPAGDRAFAAVRTALEPPLDAAPPSLDLDRHGLARAIRAATRYHARTLERAHAPAAIDAHSLEGRLGRRVKTNLAKSGAVPDPEIVRRAERVLTRLERPLDPVAGARAAAVMTAGKEHAMSPEAWLEAVEDALTDGADGPVDHPRPTTSPPAGACSPDRPIRVLAVLEIEARQPVDDAPGRG